MITFRCGFEVSRFRLLFSYWRTQIYGSLLMVRKRKKNSRCGKHREKVDTKHTSNTQMLVTPKSATSRWKTNVRKITQATTQHEEKKTTTQQHPASDVATFAIMTVKSNCNPFVSSFGVNDSDNG